MKKMTNIQQEKLQSFHCERLSEKEINFELISDFYNAKNNSLVETLQNEAFDDDLQNRIAYYVVKDADDHILFFFSLKCGLLYDEFVEGDRLKEMQSFYANILQICKDESLSDEDRVAAHSLLEKVRTKKGIKKEDVASILHLSQESDEFSRIFGKNLKNVGQTFAGIEIVHFCANDEYRHIWTDLEIPMKMGTYVFYQFLVPVVLEAMKLVGCEYLFLFAADLTEDEELIKYYQTQLGFELADEHCVAIPMYDFTCQFMSQRTCELEEGRKRFLSHDLYG